jgi:selenocysteine lyase/cysteine desulfurase
VAAAWRPATRLVACTHASNVTGAVQDVAAIAAIAHDRGGLLLVDAAQTLGQLSLDVATLGADLVAAPAHKWLHGTAGVGLLWARAGIEPEPMVQGGTGTRSESLDMPEAFIDRMETGTPDVPALAALVAADAWLRDRGLAATGASCRGLAAECAARLGALAGVRVLGAEGAPIVSFTVEGYDPGEVAVLLEQAAGVEVRSGFHCAACVHEHLGTAAGGTVRASFGPGNDSADIDAIVRVVETIRG